MALDVNGVEQMLFSIHGMLAGLTRTPELILSHEESKSLAQAIGQVSRHYDVTIGAKAMDWTNLFMMAGMVYGPRAVVMAQRRRGGSVPVNTASAPEAPQSSRPATPRGNGNSTVDIPGVGRVNLGDIN